jgi:hypothetical protein
VFLAVAGVWAGLFLGLLVVIYAASAMGGQIMGALNRAADFLQFWNDGFSYLPVAVSLSLLIFYPGCLGLLLLTPLILFGGFSLASLPNLSAATTTLSLMALLNFYSL